MQKNFIRLLGLRRTLQLDKGVQPAKKVEKPCTTGKPTNNPQQTIETYTKMSPQKQI